MGTQQLLLVILGVVVIGIAIAVAYAFFSAESTASERDALINDLNSLAAAACQYRSALRTLGGGQGSFSDFVIRGSMRSNDNGSFSIADAQVNSITLTAICAVNPSNTIRVTVESDGKLDNWTYGGDFK